MKLIYKLIILSTYFSFTISSVKADTFLDFKYILNESDAGKAKNF